MSLRTRVWIRLLARECGWIALFAILAIALTWPLARLLGTAVAWPGDPLINAYILSWDVHALANAPRELFDPRVLHPARYALTFSENLLGLWPFAAIVLPLTSPIATHNILLILGITLSAYGAAVLGRMITRSSAGGLVAGVAYGFCAWRLTHLAHLQHAWGAWLPLLAAAILWYDRKPSWKRAGLIGIAFIFNGLTNLHYLVFSIVLVTVTCFGLAASSPARRRLSYLARIGVSLLAAVMILTAILWPYRIAQELYDTRGDRIETAQYSATLRDWTGAETSDEPERNVFPGFIAAFVAVTGAIVMMRRANPDTRLSGFIALLWVAAGVFLSLGLESRIYAFLFDNFAVMRAIRAPARWAVLAYLGIAVLGALAVRGRRVAWGVVIASLLVVEVFEAPIRWYLMPAAPDPVYEWLRTREDVNAVLELPIGGRDAYYLAAAAIHHRRLFNGIAGGAAPVHAELRATFDANAIEDAAVHRLKALGASHMIIHADALEENRDEVRRWVRDALARKDLFYVGHFESGIFGDFVFATSPASEAADPHLISFLAGETTLPPNQGPFGYLEAPLPGDVARGELKVRGWALSGRGIRTVRVWFANKACSVDATLIPYPALQRLAPFHSTESARFSIDLQSRPCGGADSDILVELVDHAGSTTTLPHAWFRWE